MKTLFASTGCVAFALVFPARAQETEAIAQPDLRAEEQIVVTADLPVPIGDAAYSIDTIDLDARTATRIENTLRDIPGLQQFRRSDARSANPTSQGITLRGLGGNASSRALLILDGVPQSDPFGGYVSWPGYDAIPLAEARVRRGGGVGSDGPGAIAGTVELFSDDSGDALSLGALYGSRDSIDTQATLRKPLGGGHVSVGASYRRGDGFIPIIARQRGTVDRPAAYEQAGIAARLVAPVSPDTEIQASLRAFTDQRERGFAFSENGNDGADASIRLVNRSPGGWQWSALGYVQIRSLQASFGGVSGDRNSVERVFQQYNVPSTGLGARFELRPPVGDKAQLRIGGDWRRTTGETRENFLFVDTVPQRNRFAGGRTDALGGFVEASFRASDAMILTGGGRLDYWAISDGFRRETDIGGPVRSDERFAGRDDVEGTARAGAAYDMGGGLKLRGAAYLGWRLPTLNELFRPFRVGADATAANELLTPERLRGAEIGIDYDGDAWTFGATVFANRLDDAIANVTLDTGPGLFPGVGFVSGEGTYSQRQNLDAIVSKGAEVDATVDLRALAGWDGASVRIGYAYTDANVNGRNDSVALTGLRPAQVPQHSASGNLSYAGGALDLALTGRYIGSQYDDDANTRLLGDAFTADARIGVDMTETVTVEARAENIFGARVETDIGRDFIVERAQPRTVWIGLRVTLAPLP